jgi:hypothetical protein
VDRDHVRHPVNRHGNPPGREIGPQGVTRRRPTRTTPNQVLTGCSSPPLITLAGNQPSTA